MAIKINRIKIRNFKIFADFEDHFEGVDLLLLDGPNGYGKTSFYDALELLITGTIRRFERLSKLVDQRVKYNENPYLNYNQTDSDVEIKVGLLLDNQPIFFSRKALNKDISATADFNAFKLYSLCEFDDEHGILIEDERTFLQRIFGNDYRENFPFLNYVEQEDHTYLLKNTEAEKRRYISHLFNAQEFEAVIAKYEAAKNQVSMLCKSEVKGNLKSHAEKIEHLKRSLKNSDTINYERLFSEEGPAWDQEDIPWSESLYSSWLDEHGELRLLKSLITNRDDFNKYLANERINKIIESPDLPTFLRFQNFIDQKKTYKERKQLKEQLDELHSVFEHLTPGDIDDDDIDVLPESYAILNSLDGNLIKQYQEVLQNLRILQKLSSDFEKSLLDLQSARERMISKFEDHQTHKDQRDSACPLCGYHWQNHSELLTAIDQQSDVLERLVSRNNDELQRAFINFKHNIVQPLQKLIENYIKENPVDIEFISILLELNDEDFTRRGLIFEQINIDVRSYLNEIPTIDGELHLEALISALNELKQGYNDNLDYLSLRGIFNKYFYSRQQLFMALSVQQIERKIQYIEWKYEVFQNKLIREEEEEYAKSKEIFDNATVVSVKLKEIIDTYKKSLKEYNQALIRDIEILFHIYSGRIVQDFQGGLGLFIKEDRGIKFVTDPSRTYDAVFSMSSGQLAALVISFTLALNKKYSQNKVLFIDDPVQTMDELNIASFVEVLRNDFADRQIFISTHEDTMSTFIRYKFKKQGLRTKRINMRSLVN